MASPPPNWRALAVKVVVAHLLLSRRRRSRRPPGPLRPGDRLHLRILPDRPGGTWLRIQDDGTLFVPGAGHLLAAGKTLEQLRATLNYHLDGDTGRLRVRLRLAQSAASDTDSAAVVTDQAGSREPAVILSGAVARPARIPWRAGLTLSQALPLAGGLSPVADPTQISICSQAGDLRTIDRARSRGAAVRLQPGDYVLVPER